MNEKEIQPPDEKCDGCGDMIKATYHEIYGWVYRCEECEIAWDFIKKH